MVIKITVVVLAALLTPRVEVPAELRSVTSDELCVTEGRIGHTNGGLCTEEPKVRAV